MNITVVPMTWDDAVLAGWLALGGGAGAALRYVLDVAMSSRWRRPFPLATFLINVSGSLALGLLVGWFYAGAAKPGWSLAVSVIGTGLLGGYTTFSTASYDTLRLGREGRVVMALAYAVGTMAATIAAAASGLWLGEWWATV
ncbi:camphor resistance protein CrcB [Dietzia kunjamensis subsp. schimae]|uniref:Fluoride-specific ion channel FluC n=1 Tax=Dietzia kunjamensis subsp. schimae TaxID=498198 RepID=A0ABY1MZM0_9ACTN|nr:fluoride efflux transporter CrcB [Dietzia kunjamensis]SMO60314.1 camphor resistance protein CrcB [Dietzia kunjamensis subsp. schimae]